MDPFASDAICMASLAFNQQLEPARVSLQLASFAPFLPLRKHLVHQSAGQHLYQRKREWDRKEISAAYNSIETGRRFGVKNT